MGLDRQRPSHHTSFASRIGQPRAFSPDSRRLATVGPNQLKMRPLAAQLVRLWDLTANGPVGLPVVLPDSSAAFTSDGRWLITEAQQSSSWGVPYTVHLWRLRLEELIQPACAAAGRNLMPQESEHYFFGQSYHQTCPGLPVPALAPLSFQSLMTTRGMISMASSLVAAGI